MMVMFWLIMAVIVGIIASARSRSGIGWFLYGLLLWPVALVHVLVIDRAGRRCPHCAETVRDAAVICPHCRTQLVALN